MAKAVAKTQEVKTIENLLSIIADQGLFLKLKPMDREFLLEAADTIKYDKTNFGETKDCYLVINTDNFETDYFDSDDLNPDDFDVSVQITFKGKKLTVSVEDFTVNEY